MSTTLIMESPDFLQTSLAGAMALGLERGSFYRNAYPGSLNLLMTYQDGCRANCSYCGLAQKRCAAPENTTFIRVKWPVYELSRIMDILVQPPPDAAAGVKRFGRICVSMITHPRAERDCVDIVQRLCSTVSTPLSVLVSPTLVQDAEAFFVRLKEAGADWAGIAIDAATPEIFAAMRGPAVGGPHRWETYWTALEQAVEVFGREHASVHFIVGLGETEQEMVQAIVKANRYGAQAHLFSFCPEPGSVLSKRKPPAAGHYRRIQLAAYLLNSRQITGDAIVFEKEKIVNYGRPLEELLGGNLAAGKPFMTSGCPDRAGCLACNRPYGNERPGPVLLNYPFSPEEQDLLAIKGEIWHD
ncbi:MAG: radical SAM protein [Negativicutes bacterium]|nr:radical SAM protein [Negativicutes bacterium]